MKNLNRQKQQNDIEMGDMPATNIVIPNSNEWTNAYFH